MLELPSPKSQANVSVALPSIAIAEKFTTCPTPATLGLAAGAEVNTGCGIVTTVTFDDTEPRPPETTSATTKLPFEAKACVTGFPEPFEPSPKFQAKVSG